jgi:hypothetical protein
LESRRPDLIWIVLRGIGRAIAASFDMSFEDSAAYADPEAALASGGFLKELLKFADRGFWMEFDRSQQEAFPTVDKPADGDACLIHHVRRALGAIEPAE